MENNNINTESRREFEEWIVDHYHESSTMKYDNGDYINVEAVVAWEAWQAARERQDKDSLRLQWLLDNHRGDFEIKELIAGNFDTYYVETTREEIDKAMNPPASEKPLTHTREQYEKLKASGMMWEIFPNFTGNYEEDVLNAPTSEKI
jgi:hypothetical protein